MVLRVIVLIRFVLFELPPTFAPAPASSSAPTSSLDSKCKLAAAHVSHFFIFSSGFFAFFASFFYILLCICSVQFLLPLSSDKRQIDCSANGYTLALLMDEEDSCAL